VRIMVMRRDGSHLRAITPASMQAARPHWSPDGSEIAFTRGRPHSVDAMLMRADGRDAVMLEAHIQAGTWRPAACTLTGTAGPDTLVGGPGTDVICGRGGNDVIAGHGGTDIISGGAGSDTVDFGWALGGVPVHLWANARAQGTEYLSGIENITGSAFADVIHAGAVNGVVRGRAGDDTIFAGRGTDQLYGGPGADTLDVRDGEPGDLADGGLGADTCRGDRGDVIRRC
jgi:hemolysin type calcium-binding protein